MKIIKTFESFGDELLIGDLCEEYDIRNYTINEDGSIDVDGTVDLYDRLLNKLPLKFNKISGEFDCSSNKLKKLKGCPIIVGDSFSCAYNKLITLDGCPKSVGGSFFCESNDLITLSGCPSSIGGMFYCNNNPVYEVWKLIDDKEYLEIFLDYDMINGIELNIAKLNDILKMMDRKPVKSVKGYTCI